jgi:ankyrin repeat protein
MAQTFEKLIILFQVVVYQYHDIYHNMPIIDLLPNVRKDFNNLKLVRDVFWDQDRQEYQELCLIAVRQSVEALSIINYFTVDDRNSIFLEAVKHHEDALDTLISLRYSKCIILPDEIFEQAVKAHPIALKYVPIEHQTPKMCFEAIKAKPFVRIYVLIEQRLVDGYKPEEPIDRYAELEAKYEKLHKLYLELKNPSTVMLCTSEIMTNILDYKNHNDITKYTSFDLDDKTVAKLCLQYTFLYKHIDANHIISHLANQTVLDRFIKYVYCNGGNFLMGRVLIKNGVDLNKPIDDNGLRPIHYACKTNSNKTLSGLIKYGVDLECPDNLGNYPIHYAKVACINVFLKRSRIDFDRQNRDGNTRLHLACIMLEEYVFDCLLKTCKVDCTIQNENCSQTPMDILCERQDKMDVRKKMIVMLFEEGSPYKKAVEIACRNGNKAVLKVIIDFCNEDVCWMYVLYEFVIDLLFSVGISQDLRFDLIVMFVKAGVSINTRIVGSKFTALHLACINDDKDMVAHLLSLDADPNLIDTNEMKPIAYAVEKGNFDIVRLLI